MLDARHSAIDYNAETFHLSKPLKFIQTVFADFNSAMKTMFHFIPFNHSL